MSEENCKEISFSSGGYLLKGFLHLPKETNPPVVVGSHGLASTGDSPKQIELAHACNKMGIAYFRFDHRGCGRSEGIFTKVTSLKNRKSDLINAIHAVMARNDTGNRLALFGSSMGGTTCIAASTDVSAEAYVLIAAPVFGKTLTKAPEKHESEPVLTVKFYEKFLRFDVSENLPQIKNILIFHGDKDDIVPMENGNAIHNLAAEPKKLILQKNGDHRMSDPLHQAEFITEASRWFQKSFF